MNFLAQLRGASASGGAHARRPHTARSGAYSHRSAKESVGRRVHPDVMSVSRNHDGPSSRIGVGTVLVMLQETPDGPQPPPLRVLNKDGKLVPRDHFFLAVLAPDSEQALAFLAVQPAGTYVLVKENADDIAVYIKFQAAVRSFTVVRGKDIKRAKASDDLVEWGRAYRALNTPHAEALASQSTLMTPIHRLVLPPETYQYLAKCWLQFLPQVQAIAFELCTQPYYMDEEIAMDDWSAFILASRVPCVAFVSVDSCGFHLFNTTAIASDSSTSSNSSHNATNGSGLTATTTTTATTAVSVPVRVVEFDIAQCLVSIADGVFRPSAFVTPVHFGPTKMYDVELGFAAIRENFLAPERVALKEAAAAAATAASTSGVATTTTPWQDLLSPHAAGGDAELHHLLSVRALVLTIVPHEPLPDGLVDAVAALHALWLGQTPAQSRGRWRTPAKVKCVAQLLPFYVELLLATATTDSYVLRERATTGKPDLLPRLAAALRSDLLVMARRSDDASVARLVHLVLQALALRASVPAALVALTSDLCVESAHFRELFMRNQGASLLWKAIHTAVSASALDVSALLLQAQTPHQAQALPGRNPPHVSELSKRRSSLFGARRKSHTSASRGGSRKSLAFNASIVMPVTFETTVQVFFRVNPLLVQLELSTLLRDGHFPMLRGSATATGTATATRKPSTGGSNGNGTGWAVSSPPVAVSSALREMIVFIERMAFFFMADPSAPTWEKDVLQLLRMDDLYEHVHRELVRTCHAAADVERTASWSSSWSWSDEHRGVETVVECIAALYRLETKRRRHANAMVGDKKYWLLFHLLRNPIRAFHEHVRARLRAMAAVDADASHESDDDDVSMASGTGGTSGTSAGSATGFAVLARILPKLPRQLVTEFVLVSLDDILQATRILHEFIQQRPHGHGFTTHVRLLVSILTMMLTRTCDFDLQLLLVRVLASSGSAVPAMLQLLVHESTSKHGPVKYAAERELLAFAEAFVARAASLIQLEKWHMTRDALDVQLENKDDVEGNEQRKTMLMATVLSPENGVADSDEVLWDALQDMLLPLDAGNSVPRLGAVEVFYSKVVFMQSDALTALAKHDENLRAAKLYLRVRARVFLSAILESPRLARVQLRGLVEAHWNYLYDLRQQFKNVSSDATHDDDAGESDSDSESLHDARALRDVCRALALLHLRCLMALASRRGLLPVLDEAFLDFRTARELLQILQLGTTARAYQSHHSHHSADTTGNGTASSTSAFALNLSTLGSVHGHGHGSGGSHGAGTLHTSELLLSSPTLHATTLLTILACVVSEPHALNERLVPRFFIPTNVDGSSSHLLPEEDLLLSLQRHLRLVDSPALRAALLASLQEAELDHQFGPAARAHAVRVLLRLLLPDSYDAHLYTQSSTATSSSASTTATRIHEHRQRATDAESDDSDDDGDDRVVRDEESLLAAAQPREYIAKGAFATVYRATPCVPDSPDANAGARDVAIKICAHQRSSGELCVAAEVFNEVVVLERLRGNVAATQLLDYGNNTTESLGFELVLEHCPATLAQWRRSLALAPSEDRGHDGNSMPFRSLLSLALGVFIDVARATAAIHASHVCHFDIKADNVLLRVAPEVMTAQLLREQAGPLRESDEHVASMQRPHVCLGDFGESVVLPAPGRELPLTRTRGTEAIKSPEMLRVTGGPPPDTDHGHGHGSSGGVGAASDVWSLGCLLFELVTEQVMFANDDWAQLYAHLVAASASTTTMAPLPVVRDDHKATLLRVLAPKTEAEKGVASIFMQFLETILTRDAARRPSLAHVLEEAATQRRMILALPPWPEDNAYEAAALARCQDATVGLSTSVPPLPVPLSEPLPVSGLVRNPPAFARGDGPMASRLFFNLYLARDARVLRDACKAASTTSDTIVTGGATPRDTGRECGRDDTQSTLLSDALLRQELSALQVASESRFSHFIYFCYDDVKRQTTRDTAGGTGGSAGDDNDGQFSIATDPAPSASRHGTGTDSGGTFLEIVEGVGRTVFYFSRARVLACLRPDMARHGVTTSVGNSISSARGATAATSTHGATADAFMGPSLVRLLLQHSRGIFAVLQRHLRHQSSRVLIVPADYDSLSDATADATSELLGTASPLTELTTATLLFFLTTSLGLSPLQALASFSRECHALVPLPSTRVLTQLLRVHDELAAAARAAISVEQTIHARAVVRCRCGDKVLAVACHAAAASSATFEPPTVEVDFDAEVVWDPHETGLVVGVPGTASGAASGTASAAWHVVDTLAVARLDSLLRTVLRRQLGTLPSSAMASRAGRRSLGQLAAVRPTQFASHSLGDDAAGVLRDHVPFLLHGLTELRGSRTSDGTTATTESGLAAPDWTLYECALCGTRVCAISGGTDRMALPL